MRTTEALVRRLSETGLLLQQDKDLPNIVALLSGETLRGSWWSHPLANEIYARSNELTEHPDVLVTKLVAGKVTFVHRRLWPAVLAVGSSREPWQFARLADDARALYEAVEQQGMLQAAGRHAKELERRLLVHGEQVHTAAGHHELRLESWPLWAERAGCANSLTAPEGRQQLAAALGALGGTAAQLPWSISEPECINAPG
jgi:hypothetical protein